MMDVSSEQSDAKTGEMYPLLESRTRDSSSWKDTVGTKTEDRQKRATRIKVIIIREER
jgi:hypothetical protein